MKQHWLEHSNSIDWQNRKKQLSLFEMLVVGTVEIQSSHHKSYRNFNALQFNNFTYFPLKVLFKPLDRI